VCRRRRIKTANDQNSERRRNIRAVGAGAKDAFFTRDTHAAHAGGGDGGDEADERGNRSRNTVTMRTGRRRVALNEPETTFHLG
jgi:hypothetical protein